MPQPKWAVERSIQLEMLRSIGCRIVFSGQRATVQYPSSTTYEAVMYWVNQFPKMDPPHQAVPMKNKTYSQIIPKNTERRAMQVSPTTGTSLTKEQKSSIRPPISRALDRFRK